MQHSGTFPGAGGVSRKLALLAVALFAVAGFFGATALFRTDGPDDSSTQQPPVAISAAASQTSRLEQTVRDQPDNVDVLSRLSSAYVQRARERADPSFYPLAETAVRRALAVEPENTQALITDAGLALSRHDFAGALELARRVEAIEPSLVATYAVETDALVELGRYDEATAAAQRLADMHPDFAAYTRISYLRELHGDLDGAIDATLQAVAAGSAVKQDVIWARALAGNLYLMKGDIGGAERQYRQAEAVLPDDPQTHFGLAKLAIAQDDHATAERHLRSAIDQRPLPEYVIALGDLLSVEGRDAEAGQQYDLVRAEEALFAANGVDTDVELALFDADHGTTPDATFLQAVGAYQRRGSIFAADTVAWAAYRSGHIDEATRYVALALRTGTRDPRVAYHAGMIELAAGDAAGARGHLGRALDGGALLSPRDEAAVRDGVNSLR